MTKPTTGTQVAREAVWSRRSQLTILARDAGIRTDLLDAFMRGDADLPADELQALVREIWNDRVAAPSAAPNDSSGRLT